MHPYEEIRAELLRRISDQTWPAGFALPQEEQLAEEFSVARGTVRRALTSLVEAGLIERRRRAGTRVVNRKGHSSTLTIPIVRHEIEASGQAYGYKLLSSEIAGDELDDLGLFQDVKLRRVTCLHLGNGQPYQLEDRLLNITAIPEAAEAIFEASSPNEWLVARVPFSAARTTLRAALPSEEERKYLKLKASNPVFIIERQTRLEDVPLTHVRMSHPAQSFQMVTETAELG